MTVIIEPTKAIPIIEETDVCVLGGSCTGVFAAVRAARRGLRVAIVEMSGLFGGSATNGLVCCWHSPYDISGKERIINGLSKEITDELLTRHAAVEHGNNPHRGFTFRPPDMAIALDNLVRNHPSIRPFLHTRFCAAAYTEETKHVDAVFIENKNGRQAIRAKVFIDATGDGDLAYHIGLPFRTDVKQPPTTCALIENCYTKSKDIRKLYAEHCREYGLEQDSGWGSFLPGLTAEFFAESHVFSTDCADANALTTAEMEGRRRVATWVDIANKYGDPNQPHAALVALCSHIGIRGTRSYTCDYTLTTEDVLYGKSFPDTIGKGTYRIDIHRPAGGGFEFRYLDGRTETVTAEGVIHGRWREEIAEPPQYYQIPFRIQVSKTLPNTILAGRMLSADAGAYGALRVMINLNQTGEAAGEAAALAIHTHTPVHALNCKTLQNALWN